MVCRKLKLKKITDAKAAGGCGVVQFSSRLALFRGGVAARAASGWLDRFEWNGGGFGMVRRMVAATGWFMTSKEKPAHGGLILQQRLNLLNRHVSYCREAVNFRTQCRGIYQSFGTQYCSAASAFYSRQRSPSLGGDNLISTNVI